jgi:amino acid transporter
MMKKRMLAEIIPNMLLKRVLKRFDLMALYFALIFGSYGAAQMTTGGWAGIPMLLMAAITFLLPTALVAYELGTLFPGEGGIYIWAHKTLSPIHGFIAGWLSWIPIFLLLPLGVSVIVAHIQFILGYNFPLAVNISLQAFLVIIITTISAFRLKLSQKYINFMFFISFATALIVFLCAIFTSSKATPLNSDIFDFNITKHGALYSAAILWLLGVEVPFNMGAEIQNHKKNAGFMFLWGTVALLIAYILGIYGVVSITPLGEIDATIGVAKAVSAFSHVLGVFVGLMIVFAVISQDVAYMNTYSRLLFISGIEKRLPSIISYLTKNRVPIIALLVQCIGAIMVIIIFTTQQNLAVIFQLYLASLVAVWVASLYYLYIALPIARIKFKELYIEKEMVWTIPFKKVGLWFVVILGLVFNTTAIYYVFAKPWTVDISAGEWQSWLGLISFIIVISGLIIYLLSINKVKRIDIDTEIDKYKDKYHTDSV